VIAFLPLIVAECRRHRNGLAIAVLNICAVLFGVGSLFLSIIIGVIGFPIGAVMWIAALVWACTNNVRPRSELRRSADQGGGYLPWHNGMAKRLQPQQPVDKRWKNMRSQ